MKKPDWSHIALQIKEQYPEVLQVSTYGDNRWIIILEQEADNFLQAFKPLSTLIEKHRLQVPLIVSRSFIMASLDSYPLEFMDIQTDYFNLHLKEDVIASLSFDKEFIRLQMEREIKGKWLLTRLISLQHHKHRNHLFHVLKDSYTSLLPVFKGFCYLNGVPVPKEKDKLLAALADILHTDLKVLHYIDTQKKAPSLALINNLFNDYIRLLLLCGEKVDAWQPA